jgi:hypothetical protein
VFYNHETPPEKIVRIRYEAIDPLEIGGKNQEMPVMIPV